MPERFLVPGRATSPLRPPLAVEATRRDEQPPRCSSRSGIPLGELTERIRPAAAILLVVVAISTAPGSGRADSIGVRRTQSVLVAFMKVNAERGKFVEKGKAANEQVYAELDDHFDFGALTSKALEPLGARLNPDEQVKVKARIRELIRLTAYPTLGDFFSRAQRSLLPETRRGEIVAVPVRLRVNRDDLEVTLEFHWAEGQGNLRIVDVLFDGDSLVKNYQTQIGRLLAKSGVPGLMRALDGRPAEPDAH